MPSPPMRLTSATFVVIPVVLCVATVLGVGACASRRSGDAPIQVASTADAGPTDAGMTDAGLTDAGLTDAGLTDSAVTDGMVVRSDAAGDGAGEDAGDSGEAGASEAGSVTERCTREDSTPAAGIVSVPLNGSPPLKLAERARLLGEGLPLTLRSQQNVAAGLRPHRDGVLMLTDTGFWDISSDGRARWYGTSSALLLSARAADLDHDGDQDLLLLTSDVNSAASGDAAASPLITRLAAWERTAEGLQERAEVLRLPYVTLPVPYDAGDLDGDGDLDVTGYERGAPVGYIHDGAYGFTRKLLGDAAPTFEDKLLAFSAYTDRNKDASPDLLVWTGEALELSFFVLLGNTTGGFGAPGPAVIVEAPLVPHGPMGVGVWMADVTGDGLEDIVTQDSHGSAEAPVLNLFVSENATRIAPARQVAGLGFEFADVDQDGTTDIVTTRDGRLTALLSRSDGAFVPRDLGISMGPLVMDFAVDPGSSGRPPSLHVLYNVSACSACGEQCTGRCLFGACVGCISDADCATGRCVDQTCAH